jgi:hypothetical protein
LTVTHVPHSLDIGKGLQGKGVRPARFRAEVGDAEEQGHGRAKREQIEYCSEFLTERQRQNLTLTVSTCAYVNLWDGVNLRRSYDPEVRRMAAFGIAHLCPKAHRSNPSELPMSSECGTCVPVKARFWRWLLGQCPKKCFRLFPLRWRQRRWWLARRGAALSARGQILCPTPCTAPYTLHPLHPAPTTPYTLHPPRPTPCAHYTLHPVPKELGDA